jgi:hypothetical protein
MVTAFILSLPRLTEQSMMARQTTPLLFLPRLIMDARPTTWA